MVTLLEEQLIFASDTMSGSHIVFASSLILSLSTLSLSTLSLLFKFLGRYPVSFLIVHFFPGN